MKKNDWFVMLPNKSVYTKKGDYTIMKKSPNDKTILVMIAISKLIHPIRKDVDTCINFLMNKVFLLNNQRNTKQFKESLQFLQNERLIESNIDNFNHINSKEHITIKSKLLEKDEYDNNTYFFKLYDEELDIIMNSNYSMKVSISALNLYCFYLATTREGDPNNIEMDLKHFVTYRSYKTIYQCIKLSTNTISNSMDVLIELGLINARTCGKVVNGSLIKNSPYFVVIKHVFGDDVELIERHIQVAMDQYLHRMKATGYTKTVTKNGDFVEHPLEIFRKTQEGK